MEKCTVIFQNEDGSRKAEVKVSLGDDDKMVLNIAFTPEVKKEESGLHLQLLNFFITELGGPVKKENE